jgi:hypothetical protein
VDGLLVKCKYLREETAKATYGEGMLRPLEFLIRHGYRHELQNIFGVTIPCTFFWTDKDVYCNLSDDHYLIKDLLDMALGRMINSLNEIKSMGEYPTDLSCCQCNECEILFYLILEGDRYKGMHLSFKTKEELRSYNKYPFIFKFRVTRNQCENALTVPFWAKSLFPTQNGTYALPDREFFKKIKKSNFISLSNGYLNQGVWESKFEMPEERISCPLTDQLLNALVPLSPDIEPLMFEGQNIVGLSDYYKVIYWLRHHTTHPPKKYLNLTKSKRVAITDYVYSWMFKEGLCRYSNYVYASHSFKDTDSVTSEIEAPKMTVREKKSIIREYGEKDPKRVKHLLKGDVSYLENMIKSEENIEEESVVEPKGLQRYQQVKKVKVKMIVNKLREPLGEDDQKLHKLYNMFRGEIRQTRWRTRIKTPNFVNFKRYMESSLDPPLSLYKRIQRYKNLYNAGFYVLKKSEVMTSTGQKEIDYLVKKPVLELAKEKLKQRIIKDLTDRYKKPNRVQKMIEKANFSLDQTVILEKRTEPVLLALNVRKTKNMSDYVSVNYSEALNIHKLTDHELYYKI